MHEMAMAEGILEVVLDAAKEKPVQSIQLRVGRLLAVVPDSLQFSFQLVAAGTNAAEARLDIEEVPVECRCTRCETVSEMAMPPFLCPHCGASEGDLIAGEELVVEQVTLADGGRFAPPPDDQQDLHEHLNGHLAHDHGAWPFPPEPSEPT